MQQIGEGGFGVVYMAEQEAPVRRKVALKIIKPGMDSAQVIARFEAERQALAMMDHQNIAKVYDAGTTEGKDEGGRMKDEKNADNASDSSFRLHPSSFRGGRPYFVMELVHGVPITTYCDANKLTPRQRLELFVPLCHAVQHAHQKGIIHRDIKPSNILVTLYDDKPVPKVIDFGVAKAIEQRLTERTLFTQYGTLVGTFEYMSPEQAEMNAFGVDTRSDIYSLGVLLYELLTGTTPLERPRLRQAAFDEIRRIIKEEEPQRPSVRLSTSGALAKVAAARQTDPAKLSRLVRGELDWVVMKCLEKDRTRRYETANGLARDVERYLHDEPVEACPPTIGYWLRKAYRKHKKPLAVAAGFALLLLAGLVGVTWKWQDERAARADAVAARQEAEQHAERLRRDVESMNAANAAMDLGDMHVNFGRWAEAEAEYAKAMKLRDDHSSVWMRRARFYAGLGLWELAAADSRQAFELHEPDAPADWWHHALLLLEVGDFQAYHRLCLRMHDRFGKSTDLFDLGSLVLTWGQSAAAPSDYLNVIRLYEERAMSGSPGEAGVRPYILGTGYCRAGRLEDAIQNLRLSLTDTSWAWRAINYPVLAMALEKHGHPGEARQELANARMALEKWTQDIFDARNRFVPVKFWRDWLGMQRFFREAHTLIEGSPPPEDPRLRIVRGRAFAVLGRQEQADDEYAAAAKLGPDDPQIRFACFRFHVERGRPGTAETELAKVAELRPQDPQVHLDAFRVYADNSRSEQADAVHAKAIQLRPDDVKIRLEPFRYHVARGETAKAESDYARVEQHRPSDIAFRIACGHYCAELAQWKTARAEFARAIQLGADAPGDWFVLALMHVQHGDTEGYRNTFKDLVQRFGSADNPAKASALLPAFLLAPNATDDPTQIVTMLERITPQSDLPAHNRLGMALYRAGRYPEALERLEKAAGLGWTNNRIFRALTDYRLGDVDKARQQLVVASSHIEGYKRRESGESLSWGQLLELEIWYREADALINAPHRREATEAIKQRRWQDAIGHLDHLLQKDPARVADWADRAGCHAELDQLDRALADLTRAYELAPRNAEFGYLLALGRLHRGETATYRQLCASLLEQHAKAAAAHDLVSAAWACCLMPDAVDNPAKVIELAQSAAKKVPGGYRRQRTLGAALYRAGHFEAALEQLQESLKLAPQGGTAWDWLFLAMAHHQLGQKNEARSHLDQAIAWMDRHLKENQPVPGWTLSYVRPAHLELSLLRREAEALILPKPGESKEASKK